MESTLAERVEDLGNGHDAADVEDGSTEGHGEGREEPNFVDVVRSHIVPRGPPAPLSLTELVVFLGAVGWFDGVDIAIVRGRHRIVRSRLPRLLVLLHIHVLGPVVFEASCDSQAIHEEALHGAAELGLGAVVVGFEEEQDGTDLEQRCANQRCDAAGEGAARELGAGEGDGQPVEESTGDEDETSHGERHAD